jgi:hypothetical protein
VLFEPSSSSPFPAPPSSSSPLPRLLSVTSIDRNEPEDGEADGSATNINVPPSPLLANNFREALEDRGDGLYTRNVPPIPEHIVRGCRSLQNTRSAAFAGWVGNGRRDMLILTDISGTNQIHRVKTKGGCRTQVSVVFVPQYSSPQYRPLNTRPLKTRPLRSLFLTSQSIAWLRSRTSPQNFCSLWTRRYACAACTHAWCTRALHMHSRMVYACNACAQICVIMPRSARHAVAPTPLLTRCCSHAVAPTPLLTAQGHEKWQIYLYDLKTHEATRLTDGRSKTVGVVVSRDGGHTRAF